MSTPLLLTQRQMARLERLSDDDYRVVGTRRDAPILADGDGQTYCLQPNGRLAPLRMPVDVRPYTEVVA